MRKTRAAETAYTTRFAPLRLQPGHCTTPLGFRAAGIHCGATARDQAETRNKTGNLILIALPSENHDGTGMDRVVRRS